MLLSAWCMHGWGGLTTVTTAVRYDCGAVAGGACSATPCYTRTQHPERENLAWCRRLTPVSAYCRVLLEHAALALSWRWRRQKASWSTLASQANAARCSTDTHLAARKSLESKPAVAAHVCGASTAHGRWRGGLKDQDEDEQGVSSAIRSPLDIRSPHAVRPRAMPPPPSDQLFCRQLHSSPHPRLRLPHAHGKMCATGQERESSTFEDRA